MATRDRLDEIEEQLREYARWLQVELRKTEKAIAALVEPEEDEEDAQPLSDLVLHILREANGEVMTIQEVHLEARRRGWETDSKDPVNVVRAALSRLTQSGELERADKKRGAYRITRSASSALERMVAQRQARLAASAAAEENARVEAENHLRMRARIERVRAAERDSNAQQAARNTTSLEQKRGAEEREPRFARPQQKLEEEPPF